MNKSAPTFYCDTNIIRDVLRRRNTKSPYWFQRIRENKWKCCTSVFGLMELLDIEQDSQFVQKQLSRNQDFDKIFKEKNKRDLTSSDLQDVNQAIEYFSNEYPFVEIVTLSDDGWKLALHIAANSNIFAPDAIHLATAWENNLDILISNDEHLVNEGNILLKTEKSNGGLKLCSAAQLGSLLTKLKVKIK